MSEKSFNFKRNPEPKEKKQVKSRKKRRTAKKDNDKRFIRVTGLFFLIIALYLFLAFTSYLWTWKLDDDFFSLTISQILFDHKIIVENIMGRFGAAISFIFIKEWFGIASYIFIFLLFYFGLRFLLGISLFPLRKTLLFSLFFLFFISIATAYIYYNKNYLILGGTVGYQTNVWLAGFFGRAGTGIMLFFIITSFLLFNFYAEIIKILSKTIKLFNVFEKPKKTDEEEKTVFEKIDDKENDKEEFDFEIIEKYDKKAIDKEIHESEDVEKQEEVEFTIDDLSESQKEEDKDEASEEENEDQPPANDDIISAGSIDLGEESERVVDDTELNEETTEEEDFSLYDPKLELSEFKTPGAELLKEHQQDKTPVDKKGIESNKNRIIETLNNYDIKIDRIRATIGPTVTLYEIVPAPGIRISKIKNLEDDIAMSLAALGIRIIAPMPGKGTIGIEVPNKNPEIVSMRSMLLSDTFQNTDFDLPIALGKTITNEVYITDLTKMPHMLIAGATGQGKSVGINAILASILAKKHPSEVKFILIDPKKVELSLFSKLEKHYLAKLNDEEDAIITDVRKVVNTLNSLTVEMDRRYDLLKEGKVRTVKEYNQKFLNRRLNPKKGHRFLPYIVLVVDEFGDLIMVAGKEVEMPIARLAQLARAVGIHLIIATQRPSVNIITGVIKANFPVRIAFKVTSKVDSRTILDTGGADQLIGKGDMLLSMSGHITRLQCPFINTEEVEIITDFIGNQRGYSEAFYLPEVEDDTESAGMKQADAEDRDELFEEAARVIVTHQQGSTSLIQRKLKLGYNRAGRIIDQLEQAGIVGPFEGSKAREVKISDLMALEQFLKEIK